MIKTLITLALLFALRPTAHAQNTNTATETAAAPKSRINWKLACNKHLPHFDRPWITLDANGCATWDETKYPTHPKEWTAASCSKMYVDKYYPGDPAGEGYIHFCLHVAPTATPSCPEPGKVPVKLGPLWKTQGKYFEPLDCSWHLGIDPRIDLPEPTPAK